jgi:hypothetical protein
MDFNGIEKQWLLECVDKRENEDGPQGNQDRANKFVLGMKILQWLEEPDPEPEPPKEPKGKK